MFGGQVLSIVLRLLLVFLLSHSMIVPGSISSSLSETAAAALANKGSWFDPGGICLILLRVRCKYHLPWQCLKGLLLAGIVYNGSKYAVC